MKVRSNRLRNHSARSAISAPTAGIAGRLRSGAQRTRSTTTNSGKLTSPDLKAQICAFVRHRFLKAQICAFACVTNNHSSTAFFSFSFFQLRAHAPHVSPPPSLRLELLCQLGFKGCRCTFGSLLPGDPVSHVLCRLGIWGSAQQGRPRCSEFSSTAPHMFLGASQNFQLPSTQTRGIWKKSS